MLTPDAVKSNGNTKQQPHFAGAALADETDNDAQLEQANEDLQPPYIDFNNPSFTNDGMPYPSRSPLLTNENQTGSQTLYDGDLLVVTALVILRPCFASGRDL